MKTVCLIGRPNTGKSSLFNRLIGEKKAIIMDMPGITRDRIYSVVTYKNRSFSLIDTGGLELGNDSFQEDILMQATFAIEEADLVLFIVDGKSELNQSDYMIRDLLKKTQKEVIVVINKMDNAKREEDIYRFYELGFANIMPISATHNRGITNLLDVITKDVKENVLKEEERICRFSFIGRPNVGKSSLVNAILNEERAIVSDVAGTTRDATDTKFTYHGKDYIMVDTAGMRKKGKIYESVEKYSLLRSLKAIEDSDVCVLVIDALEGITLHDKHIAGLALDLGKALVICVNKWDTVTSEEEKKLWPEKIKYELQFATFAPVVFLSALTKKRIHLLMPEVIKAYENHGQMIKTSLLNNVIHEAVLLHEPPSYKGKRLKIYFVNEEEARPPKFVFYVNDKGLVHFSYQRYLENKLRENFSLEGTPVIFKFKNRSEE